MVQCLASRPGRLASIFRAAGFGARRVYSSSDPSSTVGEMSWNRFPCSWRIWVSNDEQAPTTRPAKAEVGPDRGRHTWRWKEWSDERTTTWRKIAMTPDEIDAFLSSQRVCRVVTIGALALLSPDRQLVAVNQIPPRTGQRLKCLVPVVPTAFTRPSLPQSHRGGGS